MRVRARLEPTLPPPAIRTYMRLAERALVRADGRGDGLDRARGRAHDVEPARGVEVGARRVEHADDDRRHVEELLCDLSDHDVRVVAVGGDDDGVGVLDPGGPQKL